MSAHLVAAVPDHNPGTIALAGGRPLTRRIEAVFAVEDVPGAVGADDKVEADVHAELAVWSQETGLGNELKVSIAGPERRHARLGGAQRGSII